MRDGKDKNFKDLNELALALRVHPSLNSLAEYCQQRERGQRQQAFAALRQFLQEAACLPAADARSACLTILNLHNHAPDVHLLISHPLRTQFLIPTLEAWVRDEPLAPIPLRELGLLTRNPALVQRALSLAPGDIAARRFLIGVRLTYVDYATHHLAESILLHDLATTRAALTEARDLMHAAHDPAPFQDLLQEALHYEQLLADWATYLETRAGTFPEWCQKHNRPYRWPATYYFH